MVFDTLTRFDSNVASAWTGVRNGFVYLNIHQVPLESIDNRVHPEILEMGNHDTVGLPSKHDTLVNAGLVLAHRLRRWASSKLTVDQRLIHDVGPTVNQR